jgi:hypothetical protein
VFANLPLSELEELQRDIRAYQELEGDAGENRAYWSALRTVCDDETGRVRARDEGIAAGKSLAALEEVDDEIDAMFAGKDEEGLAAMEESVRGTIRGAVRGGGGGGDGRGHGGGHGRGGGGGAAAPAVDVEYWEGVLRHLKVAQAKASLLRMHEDLLLKRLAQLERKKEELRARRRALVQARGGGGGGGAAAEGAGAAGEGDGWESDTGAGPRAGAEDGSYSPQLQAFDDGGDAAAGSYSPAYEVEGEGGGAAAASAAGGGGAVVDESADRRRLLEQRIAVLRKSGLLPAEAAAIAAAEREAAGGGGGEEAAPFVSETGKVLPTGDAEGNLGADAEVALPAAGGAGGSSVSYVPAAIAAGLDPQQLALWQDKYRPRKPRYFNRVKTGYDWNKYNQAHYDHDNPPPKTVQGYKFNIFYPDLLDRTKAPQYFLEPADSDEYCIIRFHAGPPYEDVAFKIVNKEWEYQRKHGFRCVFDRGILQLHFNFKRYRYRK